MLNKTLLCLTLHGIASSSPYLAQQRSVNLLNSRIFDSFSTFSYNVNHLYIRGSSFSNFLDSAISVQRGESHVYNKLYEARPEQPLIGDDIEIQDAYFYKCLSRSDGGAINYFSPDSGSLVVRSTTFVQCHSGPNPSDGGCIAFTGLRSTIHTTCAAQSSAGRNGHSFCVTISKGTSDTPNHLNQSSVIECSPKESARGWQSVFMSHGRIRIIDLNSSFNAVATQAAALMMHTVDSDAICLHSTIIYNIGPWIIYLYGKDGATLEQSNIVSNICASKDQNGVIMFHKFGRINNCLFANNRGRLFKQNRAKATIDVSNCVFDQVFDHEPGVETTNCRFEEPDVQTYVLAHLQTAFCHAKRDVIKSPIGTNEIFARLKAYFHEQAQSLLNWMK